MFTFKKLISISLLLSLCFASTVPKRSIPLVSCGKPSPFYCPPEPNRIVSITPGILKVPVNRQTTAREDTDFAVQSTSSGYGRVTRVGVSVQRGTTSTMKYEIRLTAISSQVLSTLDATFRETLNESELEDYEDLFAGYEGGLNVPFLEFMGIHLSGTTDIESQRVLSQVLSDFDSKSLVVQNVLETTSEEKLEVRGMLEATGTSLRPVEGFAFIRTATINFHDGTSKTVVTTDPNETEAATINGRRVFPSKNRSLDVVPL